jgi:hypothetical protein
MKLKLKDATLIPLRRSRLNRWVLDILTEKNFQKVFQNEDGGTGVYMREGTTSRVMVGERPYGEFYDFYSISPEYFGFHHRSLSKVMCHLVHELEITLCRSDILWTVHRDIFT